jgi:hypothetical protein
VVGGVEREHRHSDVVTAFARRNKKPPRRVAVQKEKSEAYIRSTFAAPACSTSPAVCGGGSTRQPGRSRMATYQRWADAWGLSQPPG